MLVLVRWRIHSNSDQGTKPSTEGMAPWLGPGKAGRTFWKFSKPFILFTKTTMKLFHDDVYESLHKLFGGPASFDFNNQTLASVDPAIIKVSTWIFLV